MSMVEPKDETAAISERAVRNLPAIAPPRLPYHPAIEERFGVGLTEWRALVDAVFPLAKEVSSVILALSYCRARKLDPFKRPVHIVPMWNNSLNRMVETVWPGIGELRTTAFRTGQYAGRDEAKYGETIHAKIGATEVEYPEWCQVTVYRLLAGQRLPFPGPRVYWKESYASVKKDDPSPNAMWRRRPFGQIDKCAEAAALRAAFPEEVGNEYAAEEMEGKSLGPETAARAISSGPTKTLDDKLEILGNGPSPTVNHDPETGEIVPDKDIHADAPPTATEAQGQPAAEAEGKTAAPAPKPDAAKPAAKDKPTPEQLTMGAEAASRGTAILRTYLQGYDSNGGAEKAFGRATIDGWFRNAGVADRAIAEEEAAGLGAA